MSRRQSVGGELDKLQLECFIINACNIKDASCNGNRPLHNGFMIVENVAHSGEREGSLSVIITNYYCTLHDARLQSHLGQILQLL
jgi:hypothetical protein